MQNKGKNAIASKNFHVKGNLKLSLETQRITIMLKDVETELLSKINLLCHEPMSETNFSIY